MIASPIRWTFTQRNLYLEAPATGPFPDHGIRPGDYVSLMDWPSQVYAEVMKVELEGRHIEVVMYEEHMRERYVLLEPVYKMRAVMKAGEADETFYRRVRLHDSNGRFDYGVFTRFGSAS